MTDHHRPAGVPIGRALDLPAGIAYDDLREVVAAIDRVHGDGELSRIPVRLMRGLADFGRFRFDPETGEPISISINPSQPHREIALLHEIGHFLDWQSLGDGQGFGSLSNPLLVDWLDAVVQSRAYRELEDILRRGTADVHGVAGPRQLLTNSHLFNLRSLVRPEEYWARTYAQYMVRMFPRSVMIESLNLFRRRRHGQVYYPYHWDDDDFDPIASTIDALFERLEWRT